MKRSAQLSILIFVLVALVFIGWLSIQKDSPLYQPIEAYELTTPVNQVSVKEINDAVKPYLGKSFWDISLNKIQADLTRLDWVKSAKIKRKWPNYLYISLVEQVPIARWEKDGLVNRSGEVFFPSSIKGFENLVRLSGPLEESNWIFGYLIRVQKLLNPLNLVVKSLALSKDAVWHIQLLNGPVIVLNSQDDNQKLQRFIKAYSKIKSGLRKSARVYDLRYSNGFIVAQ